MPVDEEFLEEMQKYIEEYHKMTGAPDKIARLSKTLEQTSKYLNRILKDKVEPVDFILKEQKFMKRKERRTCGRGRL